MLNGEQISEIRDHLDRAQNPVFFYDNDADGFCSYVLFRKMIERGRGVAVKSHPDVDESYAKKAQELNADYVFVLDRPILGEKFVKEIEVLGLPIVWIDHHETNDKDYAYENLFRYNCTDGTEKSSEPVSYWAYKITNRKEDEWVCVMGCIADNFLPDFGEGFIENYPELWGKNVKLPFDAYYGTEIGKLARVIGFALKDSVTHVIQLQNFVIQCKGPNDFLAELESSKSFARKYRDLRKKYDLLMEKAKENVGEKMLFFNYGGDISISSEISNELCYLYPDKTIVVAYTSGPITNISLRGNDVRGIIEEILPTFENSSGGGHKDAVGARLQSKDLERFKEGVIGKLE